MASSLFSPTLLTANAASISSIQLAWVNPSGIFDTILVWRSDDPAGPWLNIADVGPASVSFLDTGLAPGTTAYYKLNVQRRKRFSDFSNTASATTPLSKTTVLVSESIAAPGILLDRNQIAFDGGLESFIYQDAATNKHIIRTLDASGNIGESPFTLPAWNYVLSHAFNFLANKNVTLSMEPNSQYSQFVVEGGPTFKFGDPNTRPQGLIKLKSGGFAGAFGQVGSPVIGLAYLSPSGTFSVHPATLSNDSSTFNVSSAIAQHPVDNSIWGFYGRDSTGLIRAIKAHEVGDSLVIDFAQTEFLGHIDHNLIDDNSPNGELPHMEATPDATRGVIQLAYQSAHQQIFSTSPFIKGAWVCIASVHADASKTFSLYQNYIERISNFGLLTNPKGIFLAVSPIDPALLTFPNLKIVSMPSQAVIYDRLSVRVISSLTGTDWLTDNDPAGAITHRIQLT